MMKQLRIFLVLGFACTFLFISCKDNTTGTVEDEDDQIDLSEPLERLPGDDNKDIINATFDFTYPSEIKDEFVTTQEVGGYDQRILRTEIEVSFQESTTVRQINELLDTYNAKIVDMLEGINSVILLIPDPDDLENLREVIEKIESENFVEYVIESVIINEPSFSEGLEEDPKKIPTHIKDITRISHHLAIRAHGAWNLSRAIVEPEQRPWFVIPDYFGDGPPGKGYNAVFTDSDFNSGDVHSHGYHVLGIALGRFSEVNGLSPDQNDVTGIFPDQLRVRAIDLKKIFTFRRYTNAVIKLIREIRSDSPEAKIILNTSIGNKYNNYFTREITRGFAYEWIKKVRGSLVRENLEDKFIHFTSAGNLSDNQTRYPANENSEFALAGLEDVSHPTIPLVERRKLNNIFVVENRVISDPENNQRPNPGCAQKSSIMGGNLSTIGTAVYSFGKCLQQGTNDCILYGSDSNTSLATGTSMSTPQAAGVAAFIWSVNPDLSVAEVMQIIIDTAEKREDASGLFPCNNITPQPVIDAYAAVLAAGGDRARSALLDVNEDGTFDEKDIEIYLLEFDERTGALDYSRFDLNGTGKTGGNSTDRFDLNHELTYGIVTQNIEGENVEFDESTLTDQEILCYYAYSDSFEGSGELRKELLNGVCTINKLPSVSTSSISSITENSAQSGGQVTDDGGSNVTARGVCWSTSQNPTTFDECTVDGSGTGSFTSNLTNLSPGTQYYVQAYATNSEGSAYGNQRNFTTDSSSDDGDWPKDTETEVVDVTNPATGKTWMDRNLGASRAATSSTDEEAYGDLYQWGRAADGHQKRNSGTTSTLSSTDKPGHGNFILAPDYPHDWRSPKNDDLWQGVNGENNPCPSDYRLPTEAELIAERQSWSSNDAAGAFTSPLKLPAAGLRGLSGDKIGVDIEGAYWSSTVRSIGSVTGTGARDLGFSTFSAGMNSAPRVGGFSVRCLKN